MRWVMGWVLVGLGTPLISGCQAGTTEEDVALWQLDPGSSVDAGSTSLHVLVTRLA